MQSITSRDNPLIKQAVRLRENASERRAQGLFFLEGYRLCADALASGYATETLFFTEAARRKYDVASLEAAAGRAVEITQPVAQKLGDTQTPQGIFSISATKQLPGRLREMGKYMALEDVQDPGNLGAVARTAEALGLDGLIVSGGCDVYHPKALRASMGALLRLPVMQAENLPDTLRQSPLPCYAAVPDADATPVTRCDFTRGGIAVIGNEGSGLSQNTIAACMHKITIPMCTCAQSLNAAAAAAIILWEMARNVEP